MKIAIPVYDGQLCQHFGHCDKFAVVDIDDNAGKILGREDLTPPPHEPGVLPKWLADMGTSLIIAGGMGQRAQQLFAQSGIEVIVGAPANSPDELVMAYVNKALVTGQNTCDH